MNKVRMFKGVTVSEARAVHDKLCQYCLDEPATGVVMTPNGILRCGDNCFAIMAHVGRAKLETKLPTVT